MSSSGKPEPGARRRPPERGGHTRALVGLLAANLGAQGLLALVLVLPLGLAGRDRDAAETARRRNREIVSALGLTDLALWPGSSHTRHPSQTDLFAPFSDGPAAFERLPAGSLIPPPPRIDAGRRTP